MKSVLAVSVICLAASLGACSNLPVAGIDAASGAQVSITRTTFGVPHIEAPDLESLAYGVAYAHAQDNICQSADHLLTVRGQRSQFLGASGSGILGVRTLPNAVIDGFVAAHMDDQKLRTLWSASSRANQAMARGYVQGYNRYLKDHAGRLPAACNNRPWVSPMTLQDFRRSNELLQVQAGAGALADAIVGARPPAAATRTGAVDTPIPEARQWADAREAMREAGLWESPLGSNAWAFGRQTTANGRGMLLGNPHFPWVGISRFYQMHLKVPGQLDVMGASIGWSPVVQIGFNKDVAWSHTVSTGKRFTLHELTLLAGDPTSYMVDGKPEKMVPRTVSYQVLGSDGQTSTRQVTVWQTRYGPVMANPRAGLNWTDKLAYALKDANAGGLRSTDTYLGLATARNVAEVQKSLSNLGTPWVNTLAADRHGDALYADFSVVPDVDAEHIQRCAPGKPAAALLGAAGLVILDGSRSACDWRVDSASPVPGLIPPARLPLVVRQDWVHNSNDSFFYTHPQARWTGISLMVGDDAVRRPRTRASLVEIPEMVSRGKVTLAAMQEQLFENRNFVARQVLPDLLAACPHAPSNETRDGCDALRIFSEQGLRNDTGARGAHLFREFWRAASTVAGVYREPFDKMRPVQTPTGLRFSDAAVAAKIWDALAGAVKKVRSAGFALDATLGEVQRPVLTDEAIALHGGDEIEGVLNNLGDRTRPGITDKGLRIDYGSSYIQTVTFDERGPVAQALLTYGQSTNPASPHLSDQLRLYAAKQWPQLPFHPEDIARNRIGQTLRLSHP
jgi:acyl-homoserine-lactone acylase